MFWASANKLVFKHLLAVLYFIFRCLGQVCLACGFIIVEALTIQMCKLQDGNDEDDDDDDDHVQEVNSKTKKQSAGHGSIGRQVVFTLIAQATISPVGKTQSERHRVERRARQWKTDTCKRTGRQTDKQTASTQSGQSGSGLGEGGTVTRAKE